MHKQQMVIRSAELSDRQAILEVMRPWNMHHVPSAEMDELDLTCFYVALVDDKIVGASGYKILTPTVGKTTLMAVMPEFSSMGLGKKLHHIRCQVMFDKGVERVITNSDLPGTISWYKKNFGYKIVGTLPKVASFGSDDIDSWTTMEMDLQKYMKDIARKRNKTAEKSCEEKRDCREFNSTGNCL